MVPQIVRWAHRTDLAVVSSSVGVAIVVYIAGGVAYNRIVNNARGLKQIPNYKAWAEAFDFIKASCRTVFAAFF